EIALDAPDDRADLVVVAKRAADQITRRLIGCRGHPRPVRRAPTVAAVEADIESGPVVVGDHRAYRAFVNGTWYVRRVRGERTRQQGQGRKCAPEKFEVHSLVSH